ncbi:thioesterase [Marinobacterium nitratireducens]|uniref:Thioesterase n=1 Tax=Marinobacterium nitratireducens TaxID=518897 RepID=A0A917ZG32_9GAMM|nr:PaaI family thioesterase [Marinobacterium nitratireducens]GGO81324.1 thioesterase [Marinobacterium nitratireducens]
MPVLSLEQLNSFLSEHFPQGDQYGVLEEVGPGSARMRLSVSDQHLRPGGTVSGPVMMGLADVAVYAALLTRIGAVPLAVTSNLNISFLRKPKACADLVAEARMLKVGRSLGVGEVYVYSGDGAEPVAQATITYAIPR